MKKMIFVFCLFCLSIFATPVDDAKEFFLREYRLLSTRSFIDSQECERILDLYYAYLDLLKDPTEEQIGVIVTIVDKLNPKLSDNDRLLSAEYVHRYRQHRAQLEDRRSMARQPSMLLSSHQSMRRPLPSALPVRSIFEEHVSANQMWDQIWMDYSNTNAKEIKLTLRTVLQFLADIDVRKKLAAGDVMDASSAGQNLYKWLKGFWTRRLTKKSNSDSKDAEELRIFAHRWQAVMAFARVHQLTELIEQLETLRRTIESSYLVQSKMTAANRVRSMAPSEARFELDESSLYPNSRAESVLSQFSQVTTGSSRYNRAMSPHRRDPSIQKFDAEIPLVARTQYGAEIPVELENNAGGGDCLFLALGTTRDGLAGQVMDRPEVVQELFVRAIAAQELTDITDWFNRMGTHGAAGWGGDFEIGLFTQLNHVRVVIFQPDVQGGWQFVYQDGPAGATETILLGRTTVPGGEHYVRLRPRQILSIDELGTREKPLKLRKCKMTDEQIRQKIIEYFEAGSSVLTLADAQKIIADLNVSGETITKVLRDRLLAAGFKVTGSKGKYVITQVVTLDSRKRPRGDNDTDPSSSVGFAVRTLLGYFTK